MLRRFAIFVLLSISAGAQIDRNAFTFTGYKLRADVTPSSQSFGASGTVTLHNDTALPQRHATLQITSTLDWKKITVAGKPVQFIAQNYTSDIDHTGELREAIVNFNAPVAPGASIDLQIEYSGTIPRDTTRLTRIGTPDRNAARSDWDRISTDFTAVRGIGYVCWYPVSLDAVSLSVGSEVFDAIGAWKQREAAASMSVIIDAHDITRATWILANDSTERPALESASGGTEHISTSRTLVFPTLGNSVPTFAIGPYKEENAQPASATVAYLPGHESAARDYAGTASGVAPLVRRWFGPARRRVYVVELADADAVAFDAGSVLFTPLRTMQLAALQIIMAHQLTHGAFDSPRLWISEGAAGFAEALEREDQAGRTAAIDYMGARLPILAAAEKQFAAVRTDSNAPTGDVGRPSAASHSLINTADEILYRVKAMDCWWMLRDMLGDTPLQKTLQRYRAADDKQPAYLQQLLEADSGKQLEWFFDDWIYRDRGLPDLRIVEAFPRPTVAGAYVVTVQVENLGDAGVETPVTVRASGGERIARVVVPARQKAAVRVGVPTDPAEAIVNDGSIPETNFDNNAVKIEIKKP